MSAFAIAQPAHASARSSLSHESFIHAALVPVASRWWPRSCAKIPNIAIGPKFERTELAKLGLYEIFETPAPSVTVAVLGVVAFANSNTFPHPFPQSSDVTLVRSAFAPALGGMSAIGS